MRLTAFGDYDLPQFNKLDTISLGEASGSVAPIIGNGAYDTYGTADAPERALVVSTAFEIVETSATAVQTKRDALRALVGKRDRLWARFPDASLRFAWARLARLRMERNYEHVHYQPVAMDFEIVTPGWRGGLAWSLDDGELLDTGLLLDHRGGTWTPAASADSTIVTTDGNRMVRDALFVVVAGSDSISQIRVQVGSCDWTWKSTVPAGKALLINSGTKSVTLDGADAYTYMTLNAGHTVADWLQLQPGNNTVTLSYTGNASGSGLIAFSYLDNWA